MKRAMPPELLLKAIEDLPVTARLCQKEGIDANLSTRPLPKGPLPRNGLIGRGLRRIAKWIQHRAQVA